MRPARPSDLDTVLQIENRAGRERWTRDRLRESQEHPFGEILVEDVEGRVAGHVIALVVAGEAEIISLAVDPDHQRRGVGTRLLGACLQRWDEAGIERVVLEVRVDNAAAIALYRGASFVRVGERQAYYADGTDALILARSGAPGLTPFGREPSS